ncbi:MAG: rcc01693 family protein [Pseudomonadota bacterium]
MSGFDWPSLMRAGIGDLGLKPHEFWNLTPAEFLLITGISAGPAPMGRAGLTDLLKRFPDTPMGDDT